MRAAKILSKRCENCNEPIDPAKLAKKPSQRHCIRECEVATRRAAGFYKDLAKIGNAAQATVKAATGHAPKYEERARAVARSNREQPRRLQRKDEE